MNQATHCAPVEQMNKMTDEDWLSEFLAASPKKSQEPVATYGHLQFNASASRNGAAASADHVVARRRGRPRSTTFLNYEQAKILVAHFRNHCNMSKQLSTSQKYGDWAKTVLRPKELLPANPSSTYKDSGWDGWDDFLGK